MSTFSNDTAADIPEYGLEAVPGVGRGKKSPGGFLRGGMRFQVVTVRGIPRMGVQKSESLKGSDTITVSTTFMMI